MTHKKMKMVKGIVDEQIGPDAIVNNDYFFILFREHNINTMHARENEGIIVSNSRLICFEFFKTSYQFYNDTLFCFSYLLFPFYGTVTIET